MNTVNLPFQASSSLFNPSLLQTVYVYVKYTHPPRRCERSTLLTVSSLGKNLHFCTFIFYSDTHQISLLMLVSFTIRPCRFQKSRVNKIFSNICTNYLVFLPNYFHLNFQSTVETCLISDVNRSSFSIYI